MTIQIERTSGIEIPTYDVMIDFDDVVVPWADVVHEQCVAHGITNGKHYSSWHMWEDYGCTREEWENAVIAATTNGLYTDIEPYPGAVNAINELIWRGHRVHIVTARGFMKNGDQIRMWTKLALAKHGIGHTSLTFHQDKVQAQNDLGVTFDYAIDDGIHNYEALNEDGVQVWMRTQPHNASFPVDRRVGNISEFVSIVHLNQSVRASLASR